MKIVREHIFENQEVVLDGHDWQSCSFKNCILTVCTGYFNFSNNHLEKCRLNFSGPAIGVLSMIELFYPGKLPFGENKPNPRGKDIY